MTKIAITLSALTLFLVGCSTVTVQPKPIPKLTSTPSFQETRHFFLFGLVGDESVDTQAACNGQQVTQMQTQQTFPNGLLGVLTLGIYAPHTVKVWCK